MGGVWARVEGVVEGGDVVVVVVLVVEDCVEEGIFFNVLLGSGGWRGVSDDNFSFIERMGWEGM